MSFLGDLLDLFRRPVFDDFPNDGSDLDPQDDFLDLPVAAHFAALALAGAVGGRVDLAAIMQHSAADGIKVTWERNWQTRGAPVMNPKGVLLHWTAGRPTARNPAPSRAICRDGRPAGNGVTAVPGPLVHWDIGWDGMIFCIASGRANHAGMGDKTLLDRLGRMLPERINPGADSGGSGGTLYGIEIENRGGGVPFTEAQVTAVTWLVRAICAHHGWDPIERVVCHDEWTRRKVDITKPGNPWTTPGAFRRAFVAPPKPTRDLLLLADTRIVAWRGVTDVHGVRMVEHVLSIPTVERMKADGWVERKFDGAVIVTGAIP